MNLDKINTVFQGFRVDYLYHLGIDTGTVNIQQEFSDLKYVVFTRFHTSINVLVQHFAKKWYNIEEDDFQFTPIFKTDRYHLYKIGPVLFISHGIGDQSLLICLNEVAKLLVHAGVFDATFLKVGPADGFGLDVGSVVVSSHVVNDKFKPEMLSIACGVESIYPTQLDQELVDDIMNFSITYSPGITLYKGITMSVHDYYEGNARQSGFLPLPFSKEEYDAYMHRAQVYGVKNLDIDSIAFAGFCTELDITAGILSTCLVDRFNSADIEINKDEQRNIKAITAGFVASYLVHKLRFSL